MSADETTVLPYLETATDAETERFWTALAEGQVQMEWCATCDTHIWPPAARCRTCMAPAAGERLLAGTGRVHTFAIVHRPAPNFPAPYVLAYVELDGGPTVMANIVGTNPDHVDVGAAVVLEPPPPGVAAGALRFRLRQ